MSWEVVTGDCIEVMREMDDDSVDSVVCDPPYGLEFMGHDWDKLGATNEAATDSPGWRAGHGGEGPASKTNRVPFGGAGQRIRYGKSAAGMFDWHHAWAVEALRVLKPGGHLVAFGGTRTYHWLAVALEVAGFEIRESILNMRGGDATEPLELDLLAWTYGSGLFGFPKSRNVSVDPKFCQCGVVGGRELGGPCEDMRHLRGRVDAAEPLPGGPEQDMFQDMRGGGDQKGAAGKTYGPPGREGEGELCGVRQRDGAPTVTPPQGPPADVQLQVQREAARRGMGEAWPQGPSRVDGGESRELQSEDVGPQQPGVEGGRHPQAPKRKLSGGSAREGAPVGATNGAAGRVYSGASLSDGGTDGAADAGTDGSGASSGSRPVEQCAGEPGALADEQVAQGGGAWPDCGRCGKPRIPAGFGTALKPAFEPIVLARKPLDGTVAENVLRWGTGALDIDGCRIPVGVAERGRVDGRVRVQSNSERTVYGAFGRDREDERIALHAGGRWPANVVLDEDAADMLDAQAGVSVSRSGKPRSGRNGDGWGMTGTGAEYDDKGGPSRFMYVAKASRAERDAGLDMFERRAALRDGGRFHSGGRTRAGGEWVETGSEPQPKANKHPTVKPIDLMRWLVRLVTPPDGTVLDCFAGSGSTGCAAVLEGFDFVGIEQNPEYVRIAEARIEWWEQHRNPRLEAKEILAEARKHETGDPNLFEVAD